MYDGDYKSMSDAEKKATVEGLRDYYRRLPGREKASFREAMGKAFEKSDRTIYRYLKEGGTDFLGKQTLRNAPKDEADIRARFSKGVLEPQIRKGVPKKETNFLDKSGKVDWNKFRKTLKNDGIWKNLNGRINFQITPNMKFVPFVIFEVYNADEEEESFL